MTKIKTLIIISIVACFSFFTSAIFAQSTLQYKAQQVLINLPAFWAQDRDEPEDERAERMRVLSLAIDKAASEYKNRPKGVTKATMMRALMTIAYKETALARNVNNGNCDKMPKGQRCDMDKNGNPRARTYFQLWKVACPAVHNPDLVPGSQEELNIAAQCAAKRFTSSFYRCAGKNKHGAWAGAYAGYRSIDCAWEPEGENKKKHHGPKARVEFMQALKHKMDRVPMPPEIVSDNKRKKEDNET